MKRVENVEVTQVNGALFTQQNKHGRNVKPGYRSKKISIETHDGDVYEFVLHSWDEYPHYIKRRHDGTKISHSASRLPQKVKEELDKRWGGFVYRDGLPYVDAQFIDNGLYLCTMYKKPPYLFGGEDDD